MAKSDLARWRDHLATPAGPAIQAHGQALRVDSSLSAKEQDDQFIQQVCALEGDARYKAPYVVVDG